MSAGKTQVYLLVFQRVQPVLAQSKVECFIIFRGRVAGYVTERKKKTGNFEHKKQRNNGFQYSKNFFRNLSSF